MEPTHVPSVRQVLAVTAAVLSLVALAIAAHFFVKGPLGSALTLGLAGVQALILVLYSMGLRKEKAFNRLVFAAALMFLGFFVLLTLTDVLTRGDILEREAKNFSIKSPVRTNAAPALPRGARHPASTEP